MGLPIPTKKKKILAPQLQSSIQNPNHSLSYALCLYVNLKGYWYLKKKHFHQAFQKSLFLSTLPICWWTVRVPVDSSEAWLCLVYCVTCMVFRNASFKRPCQTAEDRKKKSSPLIGNLVAILQVRQKRFGTLNQITGLAPSLGTMVSTWLSALPRAKYDDREVYANHSKAENIFCTTTRDVFW